MQITLRRNEPSRPGKQFNLIAQDFALSGGENLMNVKVAMEGIVLLVLFSIFQIEPSKGHRERKVKAWTKREHRFFTTGSTVRKLD